MCLRAAHARSRIGPETREVTDEPWTLAHRETVSLSLSLILGLLALGIGFAFGAPGTRLSDPAGDQGSAPAGLDIASIDVTTTKSGTPEVTTHAITLCLSVCPPANVLACYVVSFGGCQLKFKWSGTGAWLYVKRNGQSSFESIGQVSFEESSSGVNAGKCCLTITREAALLGSPTSPADVSAAAYLSEDATGNPVDACPQAGVSLRHSW